MATTLGFTGWEWGESMCRNLARSPANRSVAHDRAAPLEALARDGVTAAAVDG